MRKEREILKHQADIALFRRHEAQWPGHLEPVDQDAAGVRAARSRRRSATRSSCRSRTVREGRPSRRAARSKLTSRTASTGAVGKADGLEGKAPGKGRAGSSPLAPPRARALDGRSLYFAHTPALAQQPHGCQRLRNGRARRSSGKCISSGICSSASSGSSSGASSSLLRGMGTSKFGRQIGVEEPCALQFLQAGKIGHFIQAEVREEGCRGAVGDGPPGRAPAAAHFDPADIEENIERALGNDDAADFLDLGARHRLVIGDDGERLERGLATGASARRSRGAGGSSDPRRCAASTCRRSARD